MVPESAVTMDTIYSRNLPRARPGQGKGTESVGAGRDQKVSTETAKARAAARFDTCQEEIAFPRNPDELDTVGATPAERMVLVEDEHLLGDAVDKADGIGFADFWCGLHGIDALAATQREGVRSRRRCACRSHSR